MISKEVEPSKEVKSWQFILAGVILGLLGVVFLFRKFYCFYAFQEYAQTLTGGLAFLVAVAAFAEKFIPDKVKDSVKNINKIVYVIGSLFVTIGLVIFFYPMFSQLNKNFCVDGFDQLVTLIKEEEQAVLTKNFSAIKEIYTPDSVVTNVETKQPSQAYTFYSLKFADLDYCSATHGHFETVDFSPTEVTLTTSSQGTWGQKGKGCTEVYNNPPGSDQWSFIKVDGKWKIHSFEFNKNK